MIGRLRGVLAHKQAPHLLIDVQGVCYELEAPMSTFYDLPALGAEVTLHTHLVIREDAHILFGFGSESERALFRSLIKVNGVGARLALTILSGISAESFVCCVRDGDSAMLTRLPGIGKKTAERLIIELRDRLADWGGGAAIPGAGAPGAPTAVDDPVRDAVSALEALGYKPHEAGRMVRSIAAEGLSSEALIRRALQSAVKA
jgi:Holliday junction DNA helicase RuvA